MGFNGKCYNYKCKIYHIIYIHIYIYICIYTHTHYNVTFVFYYSNVYYLPAHPYEDSQSMRSRHETELAEWQVRCRALEAEKLQERRGEGIREATWATRMGVMGYTI